MEYNQNTIESYDILQDRINQLEEGIIRASKLSFKYRRLATLISIRIQCALYDLVKERDLLI